MHSKITIICICYLQKLHIFSGSIIRSIYEVINNLCIIKHHLHVSDSIYWWALLSCKQWIYSWAGFPTKIRWRILITSKDHPLSSQKETVGALIHWRYLYFDKYEPVHGGSLLIPIKRLIFVIHVHSKRSHLSTRCDLYENG